MLVKRGREIEEFLAGDHSLLKELLHPDRDNVGMDYSLAVARVLPGKRTLWHRLKGSEVYYILSGSGRMYVDDEVEDVEEGDAVYIPPGSRQRIENTGDGELIFLCIVNPAWRKEDEEILELTTKGK